MILKTHGFIAGKQKKKWAFDLSFVLFLFLFLFCFFVARLLTDLLICELPMPIKTYQGLSVSLLSYDSTFFFKLKLFSVFFFQFLVYQSILLQYIELRCSLVILHFT